MGSVEECADNSRSGINSNKCRCEGVIVPTALYGADAWGYEKC